MTHVYASAHHSANKKTQLNHHFLVTCLVFKYRYLIMKTLIKTYKTEYISSLMMLKRAMTPEEFSTPKNL